MSTKIRVLLIVLVALSGLWNYEARAQQEFKRELAQVSFVPKGAWVAGVSVNYSHSDQDNYQFLIIENLSGDSYSFKVSPTVMFCFKDNFTAGGRFSYSRSQTRLDNADIIIDSETDHNIDKLFRVSQSYLGTGLMRMYVSLGKTTRFGLFNEVQLAIGGGQSKITNGQGKDFTGTYERNFQFHSEQLLGYRGECWRARLQLHPQPRRHRPHPRGKDKCQPRQLQYQPIFNHFRSDVLYLSYEVHNQNNSRHRYCHGIFGGLRPRYSSQK